MMKTPVELVSDSLSSGLTKIFRVGGLALAFLYMGGLFMLTGVVLPVGAPAVALAIVGLAMIAAVGVLFYVKEIRPVARAQRITVANKKTMDAIQLAAIELTDLAKSLQALAFKNAQQVAEMVGAIDEIRMLTGMIPGLGKIMDSSPVTRTEQLSRLIVSVTRGSEKVIGDVRDALVTSDPKLLTPYLKELKALTMTVDALLVRTVRLVQAQDHDDDLS